ncbi:MAG TPA: DUF4328 domain-containing protein [Nannocystis sp.]|jgi:hypothetical protein
MTPREHHRFFAKQLITTHTFQSPDKMFGELTGPKREAFLMFLWNEAGNAVSSPIPHVAVEGGRLAKLEVVGALTRGDQQVVVLSMPPAIMPGEAAFIALTRGSQGPVVFFLERTRDEAGTAMHPNDAVLAEVRADGMRISHGPASGIDLETFKSRVGAALGVSLDGIENSLPEITAAAFVGAGGARAAGKSMNPYAPPASGAPMPAAPQGGHVGGVLALLLLVRASVPLAVWVLSRVGLSGVIGPVYWLVAIAMTLLSLTIAVLMIVWLYQVHARRRGQASFSPGMAVGAWFIPIANFVLIPLVVRSAWKATVGAGGGLLVLGWWLAWVAEIVLSTMRTTPELFSIAARALGNAIVPIMNYGVFVTVAAYGLLYYIVRRVNERL